MKLKILLICIYKKLIYLFECARIERIILSFNFFSNFIHGHDKFLDG